VAEAEGADAVVAAAVSAVVEVVSAVVEVASGAAVDLVAVPSGAEVVASGAVVDLVAAPRFVAALAVALTAGSDSTEGLIADLDLTVALVSAVVLATEDLAIRISGMAMVTLATAIRTPVTGTVTRITRITGGREWAGVSTAERITDRRRSTLTLGKLAAQYDRGMRRNASSSLRL
jgi:hypothetical protein